MTIRKRNPHDSVRPAVPGKSTRGGLPGWMALLVLACAVWVHPAQAHKVSLFAWVENGTVYTESKFSGGRTPKNSTVVVHDLTGRRLLEGVTDEKGRFSFPAPKKPGINIALSAGQGHLAQWTVSAEELAGQAAASPPPPEMATAQPPAAAGRDALPPKTSADGRRLRMDDIRIAVGDPLLKELQAMREEVRRLRRQIDAGPGLTDILGAVGYIIGLVGIGAYFSTRRRPSGGNRRDS